MSGLTAEQVQSFQESGYLIFERFFDDGECAEYKAAIDSLMRRDLGKEAFVCDYLPLGMLISHPRIMETVESVMGPDFLFHHLHAVRQEAGASPSNWHQDYEQLPQTNRAHLMVHFFYYFNGLNGEIGDLLVLPKSQHRIVANDGLSHLGTADLPGTVVVNDLPPGSAVLVHSALWHARRAKPGGEGRPRYFADASYCQAGVRWPAYGRPEWREILQRMRDLNLDRDGKYAHLFPESQFFDERAGQAFLRQRVGSLILETKGWEE